MPRRYLFAVFVSFLLSCGTPTKQNVDLISDVGDDGTDRADALVEVTEDLPRSEDTLPELITAPPQCLPETPIDLSGIDLGTALLRSGDPVQDANLYLLTLFDEVPEVAQTLLDDPTLQGISQERDQAVRAAAMNCAGDPTCLELALVWDATEIEAVADALEGLLCGPAAPFDLVQEHLRPSGGFQLYASLDDCALLRVAWVDAAQTLNRIWYKYASNVPTTELGGLVDVALDDEPMLFYRPLLRIGLAGMDFLGRDEAARYDPLEEGQNQAALEQIPTTDWEAYPYSVILVLGFGPLNDTDAISGPGIEHTVTAADRYHDGQAPFVMFSGGHVHPDKTPFCEALEMKKVAMSDYGIPEEAILLDPYARHTTTNMRNGSRIVLRYGMPPNRPILIITDMFQTGVINYSLADRCLEELGYVPWRKVEQLSETDTCMLVEPMSLFRDSSDLLDP